MKPLYTEQQFSLSSSRDKLPFMCEHCSTIFSITKHHIDKNIQHNKFCSKKCFGLSRIKKYTINCNLCNVQFTKTKSQIDVSKSGNHFCSKSCAAKFNNTHKTKGTRRSKLEALIEEKLKILYPKEEILFNNKQTINSELDIYFPRLKLAFELNGIFHYEPIYGEEKLKNIKNNDERKFQACIERGIELCIIDTSSVGYIKKDTLEKYITIIASIISKNKVEKERFELSEPCGSAI
jgi:hypothetical protein